jgi:hypothetical protein
MLNNTLFIPIVLHIKITLIILRVLKETLLITKGDKMAMTTEHKAVISNIRKAIKSAGFKALVSGDTSCGSKIVRVCVPTYESRFTSEQVEVFATEALNNNLTHVMCSVFTVAEESCLTSKLQFNYFLNN